MKSSELVLYKELIMDSAHGAGRVACFLCRNVFATGEKLLMVPTNCDETEKMHAGQPYENLLAHRKCVELVP
jgi:hypothetical protein